MIKERYRVNIHPGHASKVDYIKVLNDIQMQMSPDGGINWAFSSTSSKTRPYRVTISKI
jgi:hypothetical protein